MRYWMTAALTLTAASWALATPEQDRLALVQQVESRFPNIERQDHIVGNWRTQ